MMYTNTLSTEPEIQNPIDITDWLRKEAGKLEQGQVLKSKNLLLFDAMSALEVMVPKTDSGITTEDDLKLPRLDQIYVATQKVDDGLCDSIISELLCAEATFLKGYGLADTLFTNIYMMYPNQIQNETLKLYVLSTLFMVSCSLSLIKGAGAYEDEDFVADDRHFDLSSPSELELIERMLKSTSPFIKFRLHYAMAYSSLLKRDLPKSKESLFAMRNVLVYLSSIEPATNLDRHALGFNPSMHRRLYVHSPPRTIKLLTWKESIESWQTFISHLDWITGIRFTDSPLLLLPQFEYATHSLRFSALPRCCLQHMFYGADMKIFAKKDWSSCLFDWLQEFFHLPYTYNRLAQDADWQQFTSVSSHLIHDLFRIFTCNTARQRRLLLKLIRMFHDFLSSCDDYDRKLEMKFHPGKPIYALTNWGISLRFQALLFVIKWGFDLDLYVPFELASIYCYYHYILSSYLGHLMQLPTGHFAEHHSTWILYYRSLALMSESLAVMIYHLKPPTDSTSYLQRFSCFKDLFIPYFPYSKAMEVLKESSLDAAYTNLSEAMHILSSFRKLDTRSLLGVDNEEISNFVRTCIRNRITLHSFLSSSIQPCEIEFIDNKIFCSVTIKKN